MKLALAALETCHIYADAWTGPVQNFDVNKVSEAVRGLRQAIEQAEKNQFNPDWDAMAVMVDEQQRMAKRIEELEQAEKQGHEFVCGECVKCGASIEKQEPVAVYQYRNPHCSDWYDGIPDHHDGHGPYEVRTLYATPLNPLDSIKSSKTLDAQPQREWVGLTQEDIDIAFDDTQEGGGFNEFARAIEQTLRRKNT